MTDTAAPNGDETSDDDPDNGSAMTDGREDDIRPGSVTAVVVTYWTGDVLRESLEVLLDQPEIEKIIVVDNGNDQETRAWLETRAGEEALIDVYSPERNLGFAAGCNFGAFMAKGEFIAFINPDCVVPKGTLHRILEVFADHENAWVCGARLENMDGTEQRGGRRRFLTPWTALVEVLRLDRLFPDHPHFKRFHMHEEEDIHEIASVEAVSGAFMVIRREHFLRLGGMDDNLFFHIEDSEFCLRVINAGGLVLYCGHISVPHHLSTSDVSRTFIEWNKARGSVYYFYKHFNGVYPQWFLFIVSTLLWARFLVGLPVRLIKDMAPMFRRYNRHHR